MKLYLLSFLYIFIYLIFLRAIDDEVEDSASSYQIPVPPVSVWPPAPKKQKKSRRICCCSKKVKSKNNRHEKEAETINIMSSEPRHQKEPEKKVQCVVALDQVDIEQKIGPSNSVAWWAHLHPNLNRFTIWQKHSTSIQQVSFVEGTFFQALNKLYKK